jgi:hypothetical protein
MDSIIVSIDIGARNFALRAETIEPGPAVIFDLVDIEPNKESLNEQFANLTSYLWSIQPKLQKASVLLIEHQEYFKTQRFSSTRNIRLMQHVFTFFELALPQVQRVEVPVSLKVSPETKAPPGKWKRDLLKAWSQDRARAYLEAIGDFDSLKVLQSMSKADDLSDTITQLWAYRLIKWPNLCKNLNQVIKCPNPAIKPPDSVQKLRRKQKITIS